jgi:phospholipid/cholesterol/gamma-HCH transport system permease protein
MIDLQEPKAIEIQRVLFAAFPAESDFEAVLISVDKSLGAVSASNQPYRTRILQTIKDAEANDWLLNLLAAAVASNENDVTLQNLHDGLKAQAPPPNISPYYMCRLAGGTVMVDRKPLRAAVEELHELQGRRILVITGESWSGKSHSLQLITFIAEIVGGFSVVPIDLDPRRDDLTRLVITARDLAGRLVKLSGYSVAVPDEPTDRQWSKWVTDFNDDFATAARQEPTQRWIVLGGVFGMLVVLLVGLFIGMIVSLQTGIELSKIGQQDQIGTVVAVTMAREMGPFITATILAATIGSSIAAELGTMAVSDELAALEVLSVDRIRFLVMPRLVALAIAAPLLTILCDTIGIFGGGFVAQSQLNVTFQLYIDSAFDALRTPALLIPLPKDVYTGLFKAWVFGILIAAIGSSAGLRATGGALGVGHATRQAVRDSIIAIIVSNYFLTWFFYQG